MKKKKLAPKDFKQRILELYDHYDYGKIAKIKFLKSIRNYKAISGNCFVGI